MQYPSPELMFRVSDVLAERGFSTIPLAGKNPSLDTWTPLQEAIQDAETRELLFGVRGGTRDEIQRWWFKNGQQRQPNNIGVVCGDVSGGLLMIDCDVAGQHVLFEERANAQHALDGVVIEETGSGKRHYYLRCDDPGRNTWLARIADPSSPRGFKNAWETRANHGLSVIAPSIHPVTGGKYRFLTGKLTDVQHVSMDQVYTLFSILSDKAFNSWEGPQRTTTRSERERDGSFPSTFEEVIKEYIRTHSVESMLSRYGYTETSPGRYRRPGGASGSAIILDDGTKAVSRHYSMNDPLWASEDDPGKGCHDSFDIFRLMEHNGDFMQAIKAAADDLGIVLYVPSKNETPVGRTPIQDGEFLICDVDDSTVLVIVGSAEAAKAVAELGCSSIFTPHSSDWPVRLIEMARGYEYIYLWLGGPVDGVVEDLSQELGAKIVDSIDDVPRLLARGATLQEIAAMLDQAYAPDTTSDVRTAYLQRYS